MSIGYPPPMPSATHDAKVHERMTESTQRATQDFSEHMESEATSSDRDADGRQAWHWNQRQQHQQSRQEHKVPDISGQTGTTLDLDG